MSTPRCILPKRCWAPEKFADGRHVFAEGSALLLLHIGSNSWISRGAFESVQFCVCCMNSCDCGSHLFGDLKKSSFLSRALGWKCFGGF